MSAADTPESSPQPGEDSGQQSGWHSGQKSGWGAGRAPGGELGQGSGRPRWRRVEIASLVLTGVVALILVWMFAPIAGIGWFLVTAGALVTVGIASIVVGIVVLAGAHRRGRGIPIGIVGIALPILLWVALGSLTVYGLSQL